MHTAGVDLGGTKVQGVVVGHDGARVGEARGRTPVGDGPAAVVAEIARVVKGAARQARVNPGKLAGVGIGSPGRVDRETGNLFGAANVFGLGDPVPLGAMVGDALGVERVVVDNDVVVATLAEHRLGAGRGFDDLLTVFAGSGVGGALVLGYGPAPTGPPARSATWWWSTAASCAPAAAEAAWRPTPGGSPWSGRPGRPRPPAAPPSCWPSRSVWADLG